MHFRAAFDQDRRWRAGEEKTGEPSWLSSSWSGIESLHTRPHLRPSVSNRTVRLELYSKVSASRSSAWKSNPEDPLKPSPPRATFGPLVQPGRRLVLRESSPKDASKDASKDVNNFKPGWITQMPTVVPASGVDPTSRWAPRLEGVAAFIAGNAYSTARTNFNT